MKTRFFLCLFLFGALSGLPAQNTPAKPLIHLRAAVDHLRLRAKPDKNAAVVAELSENDQLLYKGETGGATENITLRGVAHRARWYKVAPTDTPEKAGWVYGGAVALSSVFLPDGVSPGSIREDFLQIYPISRDEFENGDPGAPNGLLRDTAAHNIHPHAFQLTFKDGRKCIVTDTISPDSYGDGESDIVYEYLGQFPAIGQYVVEKSGYEWACMQFWDQNNGKVLSGLDYPNGLPALSPDAHWLALVYADPYETEGGIQFLWADATGLYPAFNLQQAGRTAQGYWSATTGEYFFQWEPIMSNEPTELRWFKMKILRP